jgi:hypothetical protein
MNAGYTEEILETLRRLKSAVDFALAMVEGGHIREDSKYKENIGEADFRIGEFLIKDTSKKTP